MRRIPGLPVDSLEVAAVESLPLRPYPQPVWIGFASAIVLSIGCQDAGLRTNLARVPASIESTLVIVTDSQPACTECTLEIGSGTILGSDADSMSVRELPRLVRSSTGMSYVTDFNPRPPIPVIIYDPAGGLAGALGKLGEGPGEYLPFAAGLTIGPGDTIGVRHSGRISLFATDGGYVRQLPLPILGDREFVLFGNGSVIMPGRVPGASPESGPPLHLVAASGDLVRSFGTANLSGRGGPTRKIAASGDSALWAAEPTYYRLEQRDTSGALLRVVVVRNSFLYGVYDAAELQAEREASRLAGEVGLKARRGAIDSIFEDREGLLWVALHIPAPDADRMQLAYNPPIDAVHRPTVNAESLDRGTHTIVDVLDPESGRLVTRQEFPGRRFLANDGTLVRPIFHEDGLLLLEVATLRLRRGD